MDLLTEFIQGPIMSPISNHSDIAMAINIVVNFLLVVVVTMAKWDLHQVVKRIERLESIFIKRGADYEE